MVVFDDFGTGCFNLTRLRKLSVDRPKIDRSIISGIGRESGTEWTVRAIIMVGCFLGLEVIAEGVETAEHLGFLRQRTRLRAGIPVRSVDDGRGGCREAGSRGALNILCCISFVSGNRAWQPAAAALEPSLRARALPAR